MRATNLASVATLPIRELATMAEALVNLTAFKRKVTSGQHETVVAPIDVALISRGEGFIWFKKKQYFEPSLDPNFFRNPQQDISNGVAGDGGR